MVRPVLNPFQVSTTINFLKVHQHIGHSLPQKPSIQNGKIKSSCALAPPILSPLLSFSSLMDEGEPIIIEVYDRDETGDFLGEIALPLALIRVPIHFIKSYFSHC